MKKNIFCLLIIPIFSVNLSASFGLNDISILIPLPKNETELNQLIATSPEIMPKKLFDSLPILTPMLAQNDLYSKYLKVVGLRFDPCFTSGFQPQICRPQIRLVWQPLVKTNNNYTTVDVAVHSFYEFDAFEWHSIIDELRKISNTDLSLSLQVHPVLNREGFNSNYWKQLKELVLKNAIHKNLIQMTTMTLRADRVWSFNGLEFKNNQWQQIEIPTLKFPNRPEAKIINQAFILEPESLLNLREFKGSVTLLDLNNKNWFNLISDSIKFAETKTEAEIVDSIKLAQNIENPRNHNPGTIDCVSCHISQTIRLWGKSKLKTYNQIFNLEKSKYANPNFNLKNNSLNPENTNRVRAFGYFDDEPIISDRVINETAESLKYF